MNNRKHVWTIFGTAAVSCLGLLMILAIGCDKKAEKSTPITADQETPASTTISVNNTCPIMTSNKIDSTKVPESLSRKWKGQTVGFCCAGCPIAWDKLSETEKDKKLKAAIGK